MIKEAMQYLLEYYQNNRKPFTFRVDGEPKDTYYLFDGETLDRVRAEPAPRAYEVTRLADLVAYLEDHFGAANKAALASVPAIFVDEKAITLLLDEDDRRERVTLNLEWTHEWSALVSLAKVESMGQREAVQFLRLNLADLVSTETLNIFRNLKFTSGAESEANINTSGESMGRQIQNVVRTGGRELPDIIPVTVAPYLNLREVEPVTIRLVVSVDFQASRIKLAPMGSDIQNARFATMERVVALVKDRLPDTVIAVPVYMGSVPEK